MLKLPPEDVKRWTAQRKAAVLTAVRSGAVTVEETCLRYGISGEELLAWLEEFETHGLPGLRITRTQQYRGRPSSRARARNS